MTQEFSADNVTLIAAGVTFYLLLALFPALAAFVSLYGFVADPITIADHIAFLGGVLPSGGVDLIRAQLESLARQNEAALSFAFIFGLIFALWSANNGIKTLFQAMNVVYEEREKRSFAMLNVLSLLFTVGAMLIGILFIVSVGVVPAAIAFVGLGGWEETLITVLRWPVLIVVSALAISALYRFGPSREYAQWRWLSWGSVLSAGLWLIASVLFSWYLSNFADYNATYGSLGAVIGFMMWTWLSVVIVLLGAELNSEMEHQTAVDTTTGAARPMGLRGATMADTLGRSRKAGHAEARNAFDPSRRLADGPAELEEESTPPTARHRLGTILGYALPISVLAGVTVAEVLDRTAPRSDGPAPPRRERIASKAAKETRIRGAAAIATAASLVRHSRDFLETPAGRAMFRQLLKAALRAFRR